MNNKKFISMMLVGAIALSSTACSFFGPKITVDEDDAEEFAVDYCEALLSANTKSLKKMVSEDDEDYINDLTFSVVTDDPDINNIYSHWFDTEEYQIDKVKFDEETGNAKVDVLFSYIDYDSFALTEPDFASSWVSAIDEAANGGEYTIVSATLDLRYDAEEGSFYVKSPDKFNDKAFSLFDTSFDDVIPDSVVPDYTVEWTGVAGDTALSDDSLSYSVTFDDDYGYFTNREFNVEYIFADGSSSVENYAGYELAAGVTISASDFDFEAFPAGDVTVTVFVMVGNYAYTDSDSVEIAEPEVPAPTTTSGIPGLTTHNDAMSGRYDEATNTYINEYAGVQITFGSNFVPTTHDIDSTVEYLREGGMEPDVFIVDTETSSLWIVSTATFDPAVGSVTTESMANPEHPAYDSNGVGYFMSSATNDSYLFESYLVPFGDGTIVLYHYSYDFVADNGEVLDTLAPIA